MTSKPFGCEQTPLENGGVETREVEAIVFALIPEYNLVLARDALGHQFAITRKTSGIELASLIEGQHLVLTVTTRLPRVLRGEVVA